MFHGRSAWLHFVGTVLIAGVAIGLSPRLPETGDVYPATVATQSAGEEIKTGPFRDGGARYKGSGRASIERLPDGSHVLSLKGFRVTSGPDLHVLLAGHPDPVTPSDVKAQGYVDLGKLKRNSGDQSYEIPKGVDIDSQRSVVIYCKPFHVVFSVAPLGS